MARLHAPIRIRWSDIDAYGHVNNSAMLRLLEEARVLAFWAPDPDEVDESGSAPEPVIDGRPGSGTMTVIAAQRLEYLASTPYFRRPLDIQLWIGRIGGASLDISYEVWSPVGHEPAEALHASHHDARPGGCGHQPAAAPHRRRACRLPAVRRAAGLVLAALTGPDRP